MGDDAQAGLIKQQKIKYNTIFKFIYYGYIAVIISSVLLIWLLQPFFTFPMGTGITLGSIYFAVAGYTLHTLFLSINRENNRTKPRTYILRQDDQLLYTNQHHGSFDIACFTIIYDLPADDEMNRGIDPSHPYLLGTLSAETNTPQGKPLHHKETTTLIHRAHMLHFYASEAAANRCRGDPPS